MYIAIDIGGSKTEIAFYKSKDPSTIINSHVFPTEQKYEAQEIKLLSLIDDNLSGKIQGLGVSFAGIVSKIGEIIQASNLPDYKGKPLHKKLVSLFKNVKIIQDSTCSAAADLVYGDLGKYKRSVHLILGTGLGGLLLIKAINQLLFLHWSLVE